MRPTGSSRARPARDEGASAGSAPGHGAHDGDVPVAGGVVEGHQARAAHLCVDDGVLPSSQPSRLSAPPGRRATQSARWPTPPAGALKGGRHGLGEGVAPRQAVLRLPTCPETRETGRCRRRVLRGALAGAAGEADVAPWPPRPGGRGRIGQAAQAFVHRVEFLPPCGPLGNCRCGPAAARWP